MLLDKKILVVEDNEINRASLAAILSSDDTVLEAENGAQALTVLEKYGEGISLILLDIIMPVMDGYAFLGHLKTNPRIDSIPALRPHPMTVKRIFLSEYAYRNAH